MTRVHNFRLCASDNCHRKSVTPSTVQTIFRAAYFITKADRRTHEKTIAVCIWSSALIRFDGGGCPDGFYACAGAEKARLFCRGLDERSDDCSGSLGQWRQIQRLSPWGVDEGRFIFYRSIGFFYAPRTRWRRDISGHPKLCPGEKALH